MLIDESFKEEFAVFIAELIPDGVECGFMIVRKPLKIVHIVFTLPVVEGFELVPDHGGDVIHGDLSFPNGDQFHCCSEAP